jgi:hypothetical protein
VILCRRAAVVELRLVVQLVLLRRLSFNDRGLASCSPQAVIVEQLMDRMIAPRDG